MTYIALEGLKGSGKSTVLKAVYPYLDRLKIKYHLFNVTKPGDLNHALEISALDPKQRESDLFNQKLYEYRALYHYQSLINQDIHPNKDLIIGDRSLITAIVTRWHTVDQHEKYIDQILNQQPIFIPNYIFYLDIKLENVLKRQEHRRFNEGRHYGLNEETTETLEKVLQAYDFLINQTPKQLNNIKWIKIDANQNLDQIVKDVLDQIESIEKF
jgi:thymidylate kinase